MRNSPNISVYGNLFCISSRLSLLYLQFCVVHLWKQVWRNILKETFSMAGKFRIYPRWDPFLIIFQILTIQLLGYASLTLFILIASLISGQSPSVIFIFNHRMLRLGSGKLVILAHLVNSLVGSYLLKSFVERSKSCLDFTLTNYAIHFLLTWCYSKSIPDTFLWWFINLACISLMCIVGELLCRREELKSIKFRVSNVNSCAL